MNEDFDEDMVSQYGDTDDEAPERSPHEAGIVKSSNESITLPGGMAVPTIACTQRLEMIIRQQQKVIERLARDLSRLRSTTSQQKATINHQSGRIAELNRDLENKIDRRYDL